MMLWSTLRSVANSKIAGLTILVPIVGYLIIFNGTVVDYLQLAKSFIGIEAKTPEEGSAQTLSKLYFTYFGLSLVGFGSLLFRLRCPKIIREAASPEEFFDRLEKYPALVQMRRNLRELFSSYYFVNVSKHKNPFRISRKAAVVFSAGLEIDYMSGEFGPRVRELLQNAKVTEAVEFWMSGNVRPYTDEVAKSKHLFTALELHFFYDDHSRVLARWVSGILLYTGFAISAYPGAETFYKILKRLIGQVFG